MMATKNGLFQSILVKLPNTKLNENSFRGSQFVTCGHTDMEKLTGMYFQHLVANTSKLKPG
jgi:hypothetical protein